MINMGASFSALCLITLLMSSLNLRHYSVVFVGISIISIDTILIARYSDYYLYVLIAFTHSVWCPIRRVMFAQTGGTRLSYFLTSNPWGSSGSLISCGYIFTMLILRLKANYSQYVISGITPVVIINIAVLL